MNTSLLYYSIRDTAKATFSRSGGPGGQNVNKVNTKVTLRIRLEDLAGLSETEMHRLRENLSQRITGEDEIVIASDEERSQRHNLERAFSRLEAILAAAARLPKHRRPTKPGIAAREKRLQAKKIHGQKKAKRQKIEDIEG